MTPEQRAKVESIVKDIQNVRDNIANGDADFRPSLTRSELCDRLEFLLNLLAEQRQEIENLKVGIKI